MGFACRENRMWHFLCTHMLCTHWSISFPTELRDSMTTYTLVVGVFDKQSAIFDHHLLPPYSQFYRREVIAHYVKYVNNFTDAMATLQKNIKRKQKFVTFLEQRYRESKTSLSLQGLLLKPVQRFPQYILFLQVWNQFSTASLWQYKSSGPMYKLTCGRITSLNMIAKFNSQV